MEATIARDGNGDYTAPSNTVNPATTGTAIDSADFNEFVDDVETGLSESVFTGATSGTDNALIRADGTSGKKVQETGITIDDSDVMSGATLSSPVINVGSDAHGDIYFRDSSGNLARLAPGSSGNTLVSGGAGADPAWGAAGSGDVTAGSNITDNTLVRGDGGAKGVQDTGITVADTTNDISGIGSITPNAGSAIRTATSNTNTLLLQAYDVDGAAYTTFLTLTAGNTPTCDLSASVTVGSSPILTDGDIGSTVQDYSANLDTWSGLAPSTNGQSLVTAANYAAMRTLLDLEAGTDFYSISAADAAFQPLDSVLTDLAGLSLAQGEIVYYDGTNLVSLGVGTSGQFLKTQGAAANPVWDTIAGGGDMLASNNLSDVGSAATAFGNIKQAASSSVTGVVELATAAEAAARTDTARAVTPSALPVAPTSQVFTSSGTWTKPTNLAGIKVTVIGGGGGGGGAVTATSGGSAGGGGGAAGIAIAWIDAGDLGATETATIGAAGAGGSGAAGSAGGTSTFTRTTGTDVTATGGSGGDYFTNSSTTPSLTAGASAGSGSDGDINTGGNPGTSGWRGSIDAVGGNGGSGIYGAGGAGPRVFNSKTTGGAGGGYGAGGGGAAAEQASSGAISGGAGTAGIIIVEEYY